MTAVTEVTNKGCQTSMHLCLGGGFLGQVTGFSPRQSSFSSEIVGTLITWQSGGGGHFTVGTGADKRHGFH